MEPYGGAGYRNGGSTAHLVPPEHIKHRPPQASRKPPSRILGMRGSDIDKYSRVIFPILFISFHMVYWMIYLSIRAYHRRKKKIYFLWGVLFECHYA
jgi:hypothetical protein